MVRLSKHDQEQMDKAQDLLESEPQQHWGFVRSLFFGRLNLNKILPYPRQDQGEDKRTNELLQQVDAFMEEQVDADQIDLEQRIPDHVIKGLGELGLLGMTVPREYGGGGLSHTAYCRVLERVGQTCGSTAVLMGAHQSIGLKALLLNGTLQQKQQWLPDLAAGKKLAAFCLSEPDAGSDAANVQTRARLSPDGQHWIINGEKKFATNAAIAQFLTVMARTPVGDNGTTTNKVTAFIVTPDLPGFEVISPNRSKCGIRGTWQGTLRFTDMKVPRDQVLGELGRGLRVALTVLNYGRCTLSAGCVGGAKVGLRMAIEHAKKRQQFGRSLGDFQLVKKKIARMAEYTFAMDALTYMAAGLVDRHEQDIMLETAICKLFCSEMGWHVIDEAVQIWGGEGYMREHGLERMLRDARINRIVEGATDVMASFVALMGMKSVGEELEQVLHSARHPIENFGMLTKFARNEWRDVVIGHAFNGTLDHVHPHLIDEGRTLAGLARKLARYINRLLASQREKIIDMQLLQERVAWSIVELYAMAAVISKIQLLLEGNPPTDSTNQVEQDVRIGKAYCHHAADRIKRRLGSLLDNRDHETIEIADLVLGGSETSTGSNSHE